ncbi:MAG: hypothetical protein ACXWM8_02155, partial [Candidatus Limnocylindrales bacterium]
MSLRGGRSLRRQIDAALSGEADPLGEDGLGPPDRPGDGGPDDATTTEGGDLETAAAAETAEGASGATARRGKRGQERHVDEAVRAAYVAAQAARATAGSEADTGAGVKARRLPDLHVLPPLLHSSGAFAALRDRLGPESGPPSARGRHAALASIPHGAKTYLAAALVAAGERLCWIARDSEIGDRVAEELQAWLGDPQAVAVLEPRTALAYERSELVRDETAARVAALAAWRSGRARVMVASVAALLQHTLDPEEVPAEPARLRVGTRIHREELLHQLLALGYDPVLEVAGRGEFARRGGLVDIFPSA